MRKETLKRFKEVEAEVSYITHDIDVIQFIEMQKLKELMRIADVIEGIFDYSRRRV